MEQKRDAALFETGQMADGETVNGYRVDEVKSALQKSIRRGQEEQAMFWARELSESGKGEALWKRLKVIAVEDCAGMLPVMFVAQCQTASSKSGEPTLFAVRAALELARCGKDRTPDDYLCWVGDHLEKLQDRSVLSQIPDEALDMHTRQGRKLGRAQAAFFHVGAQLANEASCYDKRYLDFLKALYPLTTEGA